jgi:hypothetical protein
MCADIGVHAGDALASARSSAILRLRPGQEYYHLTDTVFVKYH